MKKISLIIVLLILLSFCSGCAGTEYLLNKSQEDFLGDLEAYELAYEGEIPKSVLDTLDFMLENYTNGVYKPDPDDIKSTQIDPDTETDVDYGDENSWLAARKKIVDALTNIDSSVSFKISKDDFAENKLYDLICNDICEEYMIESMRFDTYSYTYYVDFSGNVCINLTFGYSYPKAQLAEMRKETYDKANNIVEQLNLNNCSDYEKVCAVNKYMCDTITYSAGNPPYQPFQHSSYGALIKGDCVCEGYARAARVILSICGVECLYITGDAGGPHAWNMVKINGEYYHIDITWNDVDVSPNHYFLVTDDYMSLSRTWNRNKYPKTANKPYLN